MGKGCVHIIVANKMNEPALATVELPASDFSTLTSALVLFEHRSVRIVQGVIKEYLPPLGSRVYALNCPPAASLSDSELVQNGGMEESLYTLLCDWQAFIACCQSSWE